MDTKDCYILGRVTKPWGIQGQMAIYLDVDSPEEYRELDSAYIEIKGNLVPFFFHIDNMKENRAVVTFENLSKEEASKLAGCEMYLPLTLLPKLEGNKFYFHEVIGFKVVDREKGEIGSIEEVLEYPAQPLFRIMNGEREILIPIIDEVIEKVDRENRTMYVVAPNGLIDLYLEDINK